MLRQVYSRHLVDDLKGFLYGVRRQSEAATALWIRLPAGHIQSGVALRLATALHKVVSIRHLPGESFTPDS